MITRLRDFRRVSAAALAALALAPAAAGAQTPDQVIDAKTNPGAAADAVNAGCADPTRCNLSWTTDSPITTGYGPPAVLGDVLYNCSADSYALTAVGVTDQRDETTSVSERVSLTISFKFLNLASSKASFTAFSSQSETFSKSVTVTNAVAVPPGYKGWTTTAILSANVTGSAYFLSGINKLIQVKNIDLQFPGFRDPDDTRDSPIVYTGLKTPMTADDIANACDPTTDATAKLLAATRTPDTLRLATCRAGRCTTRSVQGSLPPRVGRATARLTRAGRVYGRGALSGGRPRLDLRRELTPGRYTLTLTERPSAAQRTGAGAFRAVETRVPVTIA